MGRKGRGTSAYMIVGGVNVRIMGAKEKPKATIHGWNRMTAGIVADLW